MQYSQSITLFCAAFAVRWLYLLEWSRTPLFDVLIGDGRQYARWAHTIAGGDWFGSEAFYQAPLYPYVLALIQSLFGDGLWAVRLVQITLGSLACVLLAAAGRRFFDKRVGLIAGVVLALYAPAIFYDGLIQKATLAGFLMALLLYCLGEHRATSRGAWILASGVVVGWLALTRENALILAPVVLVWFVWQASPASTRPRLRAAALFLGAMLLVLLPVALRNQALGGGFSPTTSQLGPNFYIGNHEGANGRYLPLRPGRADPRYERHDATDLAQLAVGRALDADEVSDYWLQQSLSYIRSQPGDWLALMARKTLLVWHANEGMDVDSLEAYTDASLLLRSLNRLFHFGLLAPLAFVGAWLTRSRRRELWPLWLMSLAIAAAVALFYVMGRYRFPMVPLLTLFAAAALVTGARMWHRGERGRLLRLGGLLLVLGFACNWPLTGGADPRVVSGYNLGSTLVELGRHAEGRELLQRVIERDAQFAAAHHAIGDSFVREGKTAEAIPHLEQALRLDPKHAHAMTGLGMVQFAQGQTERAIEYFLRAIEIDPSLAAAYNNLAAALARLGRLDEAALYLERAAAALPGDIDILTNLGLIHLARGELEPAESRFEELLEAHPGNAPALSGLARVRAARESSRE